MNLWMRLFWVVLQALRGPRRRDPFGATSLHLTVLPTDLDFNGHVNNGRYLTLADLGRVDYTVRSGAGAVALKHRAMPVVGDVMAKFRRELRAFERYELRTRLLGWHGKWTFMEHRFERKGRVAGIVVMRGLFLMKSGPLAPRVFLDELQVEAEPPTLPQWLVDWSNSCDALSQALRSEETMLQLDQ